MSIEDNVHLEQTSLVPEIPLYVGNGTIIELWHELGSEAPPYWAYAWAGGQALARYTLDNANRFYLSTVLDIGAGTGINSIAARLAGAYEVVAVDSFEESRNLTRLNADMAVVGDRIETMSEIPDHLEDFDIILLGDTFYEYDLSRFVMGIADKALSLGKLVLAGDPNREYLPKRRCNFLERYNVPDTMMLERRPSTPAWAIEIVGNGPVK